MPNRSHVYIALFGAALGSLRLPEPKQQGRYSVSPLHDAMSGPRSDHREDEAATDWFEVFAL